MKILLTNNHLLIPGGTETFTYTLAKELAGRGHTVHVFTMPGNAGLVADKLFEIGCPVYNDIPDPEYDLIIMNHNTTVEIVLNKGIKGTKIMVCHGIIPAMEQPVPGADHYVSVSLQVQNHLEILGFYSNIINNGIDLERFTPGEPLNNKIKTMLSLCQDGEANKDLQQICIDLYIELEILNKHENPVWNVEDYIKKHDMVVSLGRGVYEAMACGRSVLIFDTRQYRQPRRKSDGVIVSEADFLKSLEFNCNGSYYRYIPDIKTLKTMVRHWYSPDQGPENRRIAEKYLDIKDKADLFLKFVNQNP